MFILYAYQGAILKNNNYKSCYISVVYSRNYSIKESRLSNGSKDASLDV